MILLPITCVYGAVDIICTKKILKNPHNIVLTEILNTEKLNVNLKLRTREIR